MELTPVDRHRQPPFGRHNSGLTDKADSIIEEDEEAQLRWAAIEKLPTFKRLRTSVLDIGSSHDHDQESSGSKECGGEKKVVDVTKLGAVERHLFIEKLIKHIEHDNLRLLQKLRERVDR